MMRVLFYCFITTVCVYASLIAAYFSTEVKPTLANVALKFLACYLGACALFFFIHAFWL